MAININHKDSTIITDDDTLIQITDKGALKVGDGTYLDELGNSQEIEPNENYKGAIRFNEDHQCLQLCDGYKWKDINGRYKQTSGIVYSLLF